MDFQDLWFCAISEKKDPSDPQVPHVFSASDMAVAHPGMQIYPSDVEDAEYGLLACRGASHSHTIDLVNVGGNKGRELSLKFPAFEDCCQHPLLSPLDDRTLTLMRERCKSDTIMTLSFSSEVSPTGRFIVTDDGNRITGTNLEEDRILCVTCESGRVKPNTSFSFAEYKGAAHRMMLNSHQDLQRRLNGFNHTRCENVSRSAVLALLKIGEAMVHAVDNLVTAVKSGVENHEVVWQQDEHVVKVKDMKCLDGFDACTDCEHLLDPLAELLLNAANRQIIQARAGCPPPVNLSAETHCIERRLMDYFKQTLLNNPSQATLYAMRAATLEALVHVSGLKSTLYSLCTSSLAKAVAAPAEADYYRAMKLEAVLGLQRQELEYLSRPLTPSGNAERTLRTRRIVDTACLRVSQRQKPAFVKYEELMHDPEILHQDYSSGNLELDLLLISDHLISCSKLINHDTEIRMLNLLTIGAEMINEEMETEGSAKFFGMTVSKDGSSGICAESEETVRMTFPNLRALHSHIDVFGCMLSFMLTGPTAGVLDLKSPARCVPDRSIFVRNCFRRLQAEGLTRAEAIETAVMIAKVLAMQQWRDQGKVRVDGRVNAMFERVRGCVVERETCTDVADMVYSDESSDVDHYGVDSSLVDPLDRLALEGDGFELVDYMENCRERDGRLDVDEAAVMFNAEGQKYYAYCRSGRVYVRKRGIREKPRRSLGGSKIGLTVLGTGMQIELKEKEPKLCDTEAMDLIMFRAREESNLGFWVWSKIMKGNIYYRPTGDSCMWNREAERSDAAVLGRWSAPKWVLKYMLVLVKDERRMLLGQRVRRDSILVQGGDDMPVFKLVDSGSTRYNCTQLDGREVKREGLRKAFFQPKMSCAGDQHPPRTRQLMTVHP